MNTPITRGPECHKCGTDDPNMDVVFCVECEEAICRECQTELQRDTQTCSDECVGKLVVHHEIELQKLRKEVAKERRAA